MIRKLQKSETATASKLAWALCGDSRMRSYPLYPTESRPLREFERCAWQDDCGLLGYFEEGRLTGVLSYFTIPKDCYLQTTGLYTGSAHPAAVLNALLEEMERGREALEKYVGVTEQNIPAAVGRLMDYDDQMIYADRILRRCPEILRSFRQKYPYLCVDEAQDTSKIQHGILRLLTGRNLFMVGDEDQSIYGFRAADPAALPVLSKLPECSAWTKQRCRAQYTHLTNLLDEQADRAVYRIVHFMGYGEYLESRSADRSRVQILEALGAEESTPERLLARLEELRGIVKGGTADPDSDLILSTIHSSKGLEYDRVILADMADGILSKVLPGPDAAPEEHAALGEERRLFYMGMTRAKRQLSVFRFRREELASSFPSFLFPQEKSKRAPVRRAPKPGARAIRSGPPKDTAPYVPGLRVVHRRFGLGEIAVRQGDIAMLQFTDGGERKISLSVALQRYQLRLAGKAEA